MKPFSIGRSLARATVALLCFTATAAIAQTTRPTTQPAANDPLVSLNLPDNAPLKVLLEYVSQEFGINILYDDTAANQRVTIKAPVKVPRSAVPMLLDGALKMKGLALVDAEQPGWKRVIPMAQAARSGDAAHAADGTAVVTQVFQLGHADAASVNTNLKPFLTAAGATSFAVPEQGLVVVTDYASNMKRVEDLVRSIDQPAQETAIKFFPVKHADAARLTQQVEQILKAQLRADGGQRSADAVEVAFDGRTSQLAVVAPERAMQQAAEVVASLDVDVPEIQSPVRFYKLANTTAADVLATIVGLEGDDTGGGASDRGGSGQSRTAPIGPPSTGSGSRDSLNSGSAARTGSTELGPGSTYTPSSSASEGTTRLPTAMQPRSGSSEESRTGAGRSLSNSTGSDASRGVREAIRNQRARVTADPNTNSIIVIAPPDVQKLYEQLIRQLDKRRPQVLVECTVVTIDTSGNFQLGVEIGRLGGSDDNQLITFTQFGLSTPDPKTGRLSIIPGIGFNGALVSTEVADVVIRAMEGSSRAKVSSSPRILVNDNNTGTLTSVTEFPYASVNASDTVATTSFGDYSKAGTEITLRPHISEKDYLQLEYSVSLSSFTGDPIAQGGTLLPPPRKSDAIESQVTIPDGSTIIVGGLNTSSMTEKIDRIPFVGHIPILEYLFSNRSTSDRTGTLFVFIRPVILRDDKFEDLKFLSERDARTAEMKPDFPVSEPLAIP